MLLTPDRRLPRSDLDSPFAMDILGEKGEWRGLSASPAARYRASSQSTKVGLAPTDHNGARHDIGTAAPSRTAGNKSEMPAPSAPCTAGSEEWSRSWARAHAVATVLRDS